MRLNAVGDGHTWYRCASGTRLSQPAHQSRQPGVGIAPQGRTVAFLAMATRKTTGTQHAPGKPRMPGEPHEPVIRSVARNRRARHDYDILDVYECGIALRGAEVKSLRLGQASLQDAYARIDDGELWLLGAHLHRRVRVRIRSFRAGQGPQTAAASPTDDELSGRVAQKALTLVPLRIYFKDGLAKVSWHCTRTPAVRQATRHRRRDADREAERVPGTRAPALTPRPRRYPAVRSKHDQGGDRLRLRSSSWEKRAVVSGTTLKSRKTTQTPSLSSRLLPN